jgi:hypothetical protein
MGCDSKHGNIDIFLPTWYGGGCHARLCINYGFHRDCIYWQSRPEDMPQSVKCKRLNIMSNMTYNADIIATNDKPVVWLSSVVKSPPFSKDARLEAGFLLRKLQKGQMLDMPHSRSMPVIGERCHELRVIDVDNTYHLSR